MPNTPDDASQNPERTGMRRGLTSYGDQEFSLFLRKAFIKGAGYTDDALDRPIDRHRQHRQRLQSVPRQRAAAGRSGEARRHARRRPADGVSDDLDPREFRAPTSMYLRNLMSMDTEEMIRAQPMDAVVLIGGCDKTVPAQLMGAASAGIPAISARDGLDARPGRIKASASAPAPTAAAIWGRFRAGEIDAERDRAT